MTMKHGAESATSQLKAGPSGPARATKSRAVWLGLVATAALSLSLGALTMSQRASSAGCPFSTKADGEGTKAKANAAAPPISIPESDQKTAQACTCKGKCGASILPTYARCDWCWTKDSCGHTGHLGGTWDYCVYPAIDAYESQAHGAKMEQLWDKIAAGPGAGHSKPVMGPVDTLTSMVGESMIATFDTQWDVMPPTRHKVIHVQGVNCQFELDVSAESPFTGLLAPGKKVAGLVRLGSAAAVGGPIGLFPGMGIKFLRTGVRSANFVALRATGPGGTKDYFGSPLSNHVAPAPALQKLHKFQQASACINMVGLSDVCKYDQQGSKQTSTPVFPFELRFSQAEAKTPDDKELTDEMLLKALSGLKQGTKIFDVHAVASPNAQKEKEKTFLGTMTTTSKCTQSTFGDSHLFFRHQRMEEDFALAPSWVAQMEALPEYDPKVCNAAAGGVPANLAEWQCGATGGTGEEPAGGAAADL